MNNNIYKELNYAFINIYNGQDEIISSGFIINFIDKNNSTIYRPFLVLSNSCFKNNDEIYVLFSSTNNGKNSQHRIVLNKNNSTDFVIDEEILAIPLAQTLNDLNTKNITLNFKGISNELIPSFDMLEKMQSINTFTWEEYDKSINSNVWILGNNSTLVEKTEDIYFKNNSYKLGTPVFVVDNGSYVQNNTIFLGQRVMLMGLFYKIIDKYVVLYSSRKLADKIRSKYNFD